MKYFLYIAIALLLLYIGRRSAQITYNRYTHEIEPVKIIPMRKTKLVLLGDSHISFGKWTELLGTTDLQVEGYRGGTSDDIIRRLKYTLNLSPDKVVLCIGINDALEKMPEDDYLQNMDVILSELNGIGAKVYLCHAMFTVREYPGADSLNYRAAQFNKGMDSLAEIHNAVTVNLNSHIAPAGYRLPEYTRDGSHLNDAGYALWARELKKHW